MTTLAHDHDHGIHDSDVHQVPLWGLFLALLVLTAAEVTLFEIWHRTDHAGHPFIPKYAMVLLLLVFTLPKAAIVMIYFMHLKFEKQFVVLLALIPFVIVPLAVLPTLTDALTLKHRGQTYNIVHGLGITHKHAEGGEAGDEATPAHAPQPAALTPGDAKAATPDAAPAAKPAAKSDDY